MEEQLEQASLEDVRAQRALLRQQRVNARKTTALEEEEEADDQEKGASLLKPPPEADDVRGAYLMQAPSPLFFRISQSAHFSPHAPGTVRCSCTCESRWCRRHSRRGKLCR